MRRLLHVLIAASVLPLFALLPLGCGSDDEGAGPGTEACGIEIYTPESGAEFFSGQDVNIRWHASGGGAVSVELLKGGAVVDTIAAETPNDGFHYFAADTRGETGGDFVLRVASTTDDACWDTVGIGLVNTVGCVLDLAAVSDTLVAGDLVTIDWVSENTSGRVNLELWKGNLQEQLAGVIAGNLNDTGSYTWQQIDSFNRGSGPDYYLRITDAMVGTCMDQVGPFMLIDPDICFFEVPTPAAGTVLNEGDPLRITFMGTNNSDLVNIRLYAGAIFVPGGYISDNVLASSGGFDWVVNDFDYDGGSTSSYRIVVFDAEDLTCRGQSERFTIVPAK